MKTEEQKAKDWFDTYMVNQPPTLVLNGLIALLKEQDRDTRHACAEAVTGCKYTSGDWILLADARAAIMNTKAGKIIKSKKGFNYE